MSTSLDLKYAAAKRNLSEKDIERAANACHELLAKSPANPKYVILSAEVSLAMRSPGAAIDLLKRIVPRRQKSAHYYHVLGNAYRALGWRDAALRALTKSVRLVPNNAEVHCAMGDILFDNRERAASCASYEKALAIDSTLEEATTRVNDFYSDIVPGWHFPMMNDRIRNHAFDSALRKAIKPDTVVLDIGTGAGLLAMMAARAGASHVYTCEVTPEVAAMATQVVARNGFEKKITVIAKYSRDLSIGTDIPRKADLLVTETVDNGLLGEETLSIIEHAKKNLLRARARIMPIGADVFATLIDCEELYNRHRVFETCDFDLSDFNKFASRRYTGYFINKYNHTLLTDDVHVLSFDFACQEKTRDLTFDVPITSSGTAHAIVYWFVLHLDRDTRIDTGPHAPMSCFEQPVQVLPCSARVTRGSQVRLRVRHDVRRIHMDLET
jgi:predicted RNA methylase